MEKLEDPSNSFLTEDDVKWLQEFVMSNLGNNNNRFEVPYNEEISLPNLEYEMPFLQMLQGVEAAATSSPLMQQPNYFQLFLRLQYQNLHNFTSNCEDPNTNIKSDMIMDFKSPVKPETGLEEEQQQLVHAQVSQISNNLEGGRKSKKKRQRYPDKNKEEVEILRMHHIAIERNRRKLVNEHLNDLRSLMPPSYVQGRDQASTVGAAIHFVKELEQIVQSLEAHKRIMQFEDNNMFVTSPTSTFQLKNFDFNECSDVNFTQASRSNNNCAENRSAGLADIKAVMIQDHVNLKIQCERRLGQLTKVIVAFEQLRLTVLHLNITSSHSLVHYFFNLKMEDDCKLGSADEVVRAVHDIFIRINLS